MTGPGQSPSSPWVQTAQGCPRDGRATQPFHPTLSPSHSGMQSIPDRASPNYFGITVENSSNPPTSTPGPHTQKNWGSMTRAQSSLPSPKLQLWSQDSVSEGLINLLRTESEVDKGRRESALQSRSANGFNGSNGESSLSNRRSQGNFTAYGSVARENSGTSSLGR